MSQPPNLHKQSDEIDLIELFRTLWMKKRLIIFVTLAVTLAAAAYAFLTPPVYRAQASIMPPTLSDIAGFNLARNKDIGLEPFKIDDVYRVFTRNLQSDQSKRRFYSEVYLPSLTDDQKKASRDTLYKKFLERVAIAGPTNSQPDRFVLNIEGSDPIEAAQWAELYIKNVEQQSIKEMLSNAQSEIDVRGRNLMQQIETLRYSAKVRREDRMMQLKEALKVAQTIGLQNPPMIAGQMNDQLSAIMEGNLTYMRGAKALKAEIDALAQRASDDPFVPELRNLQEQHALYASLRIQPERVAVYRLDGTFETPDEPIKPKKSLILILGIVLGLVLGSFAALIQVISNNSRSSGKTAGNTV
ncbi:chain-length determining protein [Pseudomonas argentinensis]|uniref:Chain length determinant protein (Polysaccharide antigen chain regulator) n=1 Tax=Phytopseudomonas argentinensis TaxID=289370 RepID=A0A1I3L020_9GAMM|nr:Wzz/FepE/Etk N-terminal domain-containing protein [Pseudomonas argentinensis]KAB0550298.1 chain-length determining protein [Pseudomonas argentinensis]SFI78046.1 chain length determinant protein (polysaccharide antigen chain regulator) [Pseudomonas argentinensis]